MKNKTTLLMMAALSVSMLNAQTLNDALAYNGGGENYEKATVIEPSETNQFKAEQHGNQLYFSSEFGTDKHVLIEVYDAYGRFVISLNVASKSEMYKTYAWEFKTKLKPGKYSFVCKIKNEETRSKELVIY